MPPNGTPGLARSAVRGIRRLPSPPARTIASTLTAMARTLISRPAVRHPKCRELWLSNRGAALSNQCPGHGNRPRAWGTGCPAGGGRAILRNVADASALRVDLLTREYPPEVYGGAGVHLEYLTRDLRRLADVRVH